MTIAAQVLRDLMAEVNELYAADQPPFPKGPICRTGRSTYFADGSRDEEYQDADGKYWIVKVTPDLRYAWRQGRL